MKRALIFFSVIFYSAAALGSACCGGAGPKSFISLQDLQSYELGISTSLRDVYGRYNAYGEPEEADKINNYTVTLGAGARLTEDIDTFAILPFVYQVNSIGNNSIGRTSLGDILVGGRYNLVRSLFRDDWYPTALLSVGTKLPTGPLETFSNGKLVPGIGNGMWEPFIGIGLKKEYGFVTLAFDSTYTLRVRRQTANLVEEGDKIDLSETATVPFSRRFSLGMGSRQTWVFNSTQNGRPMTDSSGRAAAGLFSATYFLSSVWSIIGAAEFGIPMPGFGVNQQLSRVVSITTKYGFY